MKKRVWILLLTLLASFVLVAGCSSGGSSKQSAPAQKKPSKNFNKTGFPIVNKPITLTMFAKRSPANSPYKEMSMFQAYEKKTNIHMKFNDVPQVSFKDKESLTFSSGNLPDIFFKAGISPLDAVKYGTSGSLIPLEGLLKKYAPNIEALFKKYPEVKKSITAPDGHIYAMSDIISLLDARTQKLWLNKKMLQGVNMQVPTTTDQLYKMLKAFKTKYPNGTPLTARNIGNLVNMFSGAWGNVQQMGYNINIQNGKVHIWTGDDSYKQELMYLHKLYQANLIDHKIVTQTGAQYVAKMQSGKLGMFTNQATDAFKQIADQYVGIAPLKGPNGDRRYNAQPIARDFGAFAISSTNKYPAASIRWLDYFFSKKGAIFFRYGVEGKTFHYENGVPTYNKSVLNLSKGIGSMTPWPGGGTPQWVNDQDATAINTQQDQKAVAKIKPYVPKKIYATPLFDTNTAKQVNDIRNTIDTYVKEATAKFITGDRSFSTWNDYKSKLKQMGLDKLQQYYQKAFDRQYK